jgi:hypothetical protein
MKLFNSECSTYCYDLTSETEALLEQVKAAVAQCKPVEIRGRQVNVDTLKITQDESQTQFWFHTVPCSQSQPDDSQATKIPSRMHWLRSFHLPWTTA